MRKTSLIVIMLCLLTAISCGKKTSQSAKEPVKIADPADRFEYALELEENGEFDKAIRIYRELVISDPYNVEAVGKLYSVNKKEGERFFSEGEFRKSIPHLEVAFRYFRDEDTGNKLRDSLLFIAENENEIQRKIPFLEKITSLFPDNVKAMKMLGSCYENTDIDKARKIYERLLEITPDDDNIRIRLSKIYAQTGNNEDGTRLLSDIRNVESVFLSDKDSVFYKEKVEELMKSGDSRNAVKILRMLIESEKNPEEKRRLVTLLAQAYFQQKSYGNVLHIYDQYPELDMSSEENRFIVLLSMLYLGKGDIFLRDHEKYVNNGYVFSDMREDYLWFRYHMLTGEYGKIDEIISEVRQRGDSEFLVRIFDELADNSAEKKEFEKALSYIVLSQEIKENPENNFRKAIFLDKLRRFSQALQEYSIAVEKDPENPKFRYYRILSLKRNRKYDEMEEEKNLVVEKFRGSKWANYVKKIFGETDLAGNIKMFSDVDSYYNYGLDFARNGDFEKALYNLKMASGLQPENYNILINIANVYFTTGAYSEAIVYYLSAANFSENNSYVDFFLAKCFSEKGLYNEAYEKAKESYSMDPENKECAELIEELDSKRDREIKENRFFALKEIGIAAFNEEMYDIAYLYFKQSLEIKPDDFFTLYSISNLLMKKELYSDAWKYIERLVILFPDEFESGRLDFEYNFRIDPAKGRTIFTELLREFPEEKWLYENVKNIFEAPDRNIKSILAENILRIQDPDIQKMVAGLMEEY